MKTYISFCIFLLSFTTVFSQNDDCERAQLECKRLQDSAIANVKRKLYITATSYFKGADKIKGDYSNCNLYNDEMANIAVSIAPASTYQTLIEQVIALQDKDSYQEAFEKYQVAGKYFDKFQVSEQGLQHDSIMNFVFKKCKVSFAVWLSDYFFKKKRYEKTFEIYGNLIQRGYDVVKLKRPLYDLGVQMAIIDKAKGPTENPKSNIERYTKGSDNYKYFRLGYLYGWGQ